MTTKTKSQKAHEDVVALLKSRHSLLWVVTREEVRVERAIADAAASAKYETVYWDCATGVSDAEGKPVGLGMSLIDPGALLSSIRETTTRRVYVLRDFHPWLESFAVLRQLCTTARTIQAAEQANQMRAIVILTPSSEVPLELQGRATVIEWPRPERADIGVILDEALASIADKDVRAAAAAAAAANRDTIIDAAVGLTSDEAQNCYAKSLVVLKRIDPAQVAAEKKRIIERERVLTWYDPDPRGLDAIGGLDLMKEWLLARKAAFTQRARDFGLPAPKGVCIVGLPGTGKSLTAKAVATNWGMPLLKLDLGALRSKYVGESEGNVRRALATAEAVAPCVLFLDEIEKALGGSSGPQGDGGVSADALGAVLSWMQDRQGTVFVIACANSVEGLPPELLRKGRFDELFFVDLPNVIERREILRASLKARGLPRAEKLPADGKKIELDQVAAATDGFTGSEIAAVVDDALFATFADGERGMQTEDLLAAVARTVPLSRTAGEKMEALRSWAKGRCRRASSIITTTENTRGRALDM